MTERIVIVGAGQAAAQAVATLRAEGFAGAITLVGDEPYLPYQRPPLSKAYLVGTLERERLFLKPESFYNQAQCGRMLGVTATKIMRADKTVALSDGRTLSYDKLLLATGSRVRKIACPGADLDGVHYLRGIDDVDGLRAVFGQASALRSSVAATSDSRLRPSRRRRASTSRSSRRWIASWRVRCRCRSPISSTRCIAMPA